MNRLKIILAALLLQTGITAFAQQDRPSSIWRSVAMGLDYEVNAGISIGGASPIPLPAEIREIKGYSPLLNLSIGTRVTKWFGPGEKWGVMTGITLMQKGMETRARVKNYGMEIIQDGDKLSGRWTGDVKTKYTTQQLVIPIAATYKFNNRWKVHFGPYLAYAFHITFEGHVSNGYLREGDPTGNKVSFTGDSRATYDFGDNLRRFQWGLTAGCSWRATKRLRVNTSLEWGLNDIFESSFKTVTFNMYPIYLRIGFGYLF